MFRILLIFSFVVFPLGNAYAAITSCDQLSHIPLEIIYKVKIPQPKINHSLRSEQMTSVGRQSIEQWQKKYNNPSQKSFLGKVFGTTSEIGGMTKVQHSIPYKSTIISRAIGKYGRKKCLTVSKVEIEFEYWGTIFIPNEYKKDGCSYNVILKHEMEHYLIGAENLSDYSKWLRKGLPGLAKALEDKVGAVDNLYVASSRNYIRQAILEVVDTALQDTKRLTKKENAAIDTPEAYAKVREALRACDD